MALIQCDDCGKDVSTMAPACPHCGRPMDQASPVVDATMVAVATGQRISCPDGNCTGIIKENGRCGTCGKHYTFRDKEEEYWDKRTIEKPPPSQISCPKCSSTQITANKKGFGLGKSVLGLAMLGPVGLLGGVVGAGKVKVTCLACGHSWAAGS